MSDIPEVLLLVEDLYLIHVVFRIYICLDLEHRIRISQVRHQLFGNLAGRLEQLRVDLLICLRDRVLFINDVEACASIICINDYLDGVSDVVRRIDRLRICIVRL